MTNNVLSHAQFAATGAQGGGSRRFIDGTSRGTPDTGYFVSRPGDPKTVEPSRNRSHEIVGRHATAVDVAHHWAQNKERALADPSHPVHEVYQGLWHNKDDNTSYLDVSERHASFSSAVRRGVQNKQIAIYDAARGASAYINPDANNKPVTATSTHEATGTARYRIAPNEKTRRAEWV